MKDTHNIILVGMKASGKSTIGKILAKDLGYDHQDLDTLLIEEYHRLTNDSMSIGHIYQYKGESYFRNLESHILDTLIQEQSVDHPIILSVGGGTILSPHNRQLLSSFGYIIYLQVRLTLLLSRFQRMGITSYLEDNTDPKATLEHVFHSRHQIYQELADRTITITDESPKNISKVIQTEVTHANY